jgi:glycosyltransferase involved in cell wall biosynthesis
MMRPKVTIVIPVYNTERLIDRCLESVVGQSLSAIEIICVDDGSTDGSGALLDRWAERDSRIRVVHQSNGRQGKARNAALNIAQGEYVGMIDSDDYIPKEYFERLYNAAVEADAEVAMCGIVKQKRLAERTVVAFDRAEVVCDAEQKLRTCHCPPEFHPVNKLYRRSMIERIGLRFREGVQYEDVMFVTRAIVESNRLVTVPNLSYYYVLNPTSTVKSRQTSEKQRQKYEAHRAMVEYISARSIKISPRHRNITVRYFKAMGICLWKIKERGEIRTLRLFDLVPIWRWRR